MRYLTFFLLAFLLAFSYTQAESTLAQQVPVGPVDTTQFINTNNTFWQYTQNVFTEEAMNTDIELQHMTELNSIKPAMVNKSQIKKYGLWFVFKVEGSILAVLLLASLGGVLTTKLQKERPTAA